jgi:hypothetical protein
MKAAEIINMRHGWEQPQDIRDMRRAEMADCCEDTLRNMDYFNVHKYFELLRSKGYEVKTKYDRKGRLVGYTMGKDATVIKASEIGRKFMASKLSDTWNKLHPKPVQVKVKPAAPSVNSTNRPVRPGTSTPRVNQPKVQPIQKPRSVFTNSVFNIKVGDESLKVEIPNIIKDIFPKEAHVPEGNDTATTENVAQVAMLLFAGYVDAATSMSESCGGGGGSAPSSGWGKDNDEDDRLYARRCLQMAHSMCKPKPRQRGLHR